MRLGSQGVTRQVDLLRPYLDVWSLVGHATGSCACIRVLRRGETRGRRYWRRLEGRWTRDGSDWTHGIDRRRGGHVNVLRRWRVGTRLSLLERCLVSWICGWSTLHRLHMRRKGTVVRAWRSLGIMKGMGLEMGWRRSTWPAHVMRWKMMRR